MDIDVYLQPLIKELLQLWTGVDAFDAYIRTCFNLRVALHSIISDFPVYANASGCTKDRFACLYCAEDAHSMWIENEHKFCCMGHRKWLPEGHPFRYDDVGFDGNVELGYAPKAISGKDILQQLEGTTFSHGKGEAQNVKVDEKDEQQIWKKKRVYFLICYIGSTTLFDIITI